MIKRNLIKSQAPQVLHTEQAGLDFFGIVNAYFTPDGKEWEKIPQKVRRDSSFMLWRQIAKISPAVAAIAHGLGYDAIEAIRPLLARSVKDRRIFNKAVKEISDPWDDPSVKAAADAFMLDSKDIRDFIFFSEEAFLEMVQSMKQKIG